MEHLRAGIRSILLGRRMLNENKWDNLLVPI